MKMISRKSIRVAIASASVLIFTAIPASAALPLNFAQPDSVKFQFVEWQPIVVTAEGQTHHTGSPFGGMGWLYLDEALFIGPGDCSVSSDTQSDFAYTGSPTLVSCTWQHVGARDLDVTVDRRFLGSWTELTYRILDSSGNTSDLPITVAGYVSPNTSFLSGSPAGSVSKWVTYTTDYSHLPAGVAYYSIQATRSETLVVTPPSELNWMTINLNAPTDGSKAFVLRIGVVDWQVWAGDDMSSSLLDAATLRSNQSKAISCAKSLREKDFGSRLTYTACSVPYGWDKDSQQPPKERGRYK